MHVLLFDTETNGLPKRFGAPIHALDNWPNILSIAWQIWDMNATDSSQTFVEKRNYFLNPPPTLVWNAEAEKIHGLRRDFLETEGHDIRVVLDEFMRAASACQLIVAHNLQFDKSVLLAEMLRQNPKMVMNWWPRFEYCTCNNTKALCKLPPSVKLRPNPSDPYKMPKLVELWKFLYGGDATFSFHSAEGDTECLVQIFRELLHRNVLDLGLWERSLRV
jgi:DNA polymerase III epsilon subunit-like protein